MFKPYAPAWYVVPMSSGRPPNFSGAPGGIRTATLFLEDQSRNANSLLFLRFCVLLEAWFCILGFLLTLWSAFLYQGTLTLATVFERFRPESRKEYAKAM